MELQQKWYGKLSNDNWEGAVHFLNELSWNLSWYEKNNKWTLYTGDQPIVLVETREELEAFILGMALGLVVLPDEFLYQIKKLVEE